MIQIFNPTKLTRQPFFQDLVNFLHTQQDVTLRQIKATFAGEKNVDRQLETYIEAGYILRENRRYRNHFQLLANVNDVAFDQEIFVDTEAPVYQEVMKWTTTRQLTHPANAVIIEETVDLARERLTLDSYFYKMRTQEPLSASQEKLYAILGDINPAYALKYMTTFLLKFTRKERVLQKRPDIFVQSLLILGFIEEVAPQTYTLTMKMDKEQLLFKKE